MNELVIEITENNKEVAGKAIDDQIELVVQEWFNDILVKIMSKEDWDFIVKDSAKSAQKMLKKYGIDLSILKFMDETWYVIYKDKKVFDYKIIMIWGGNC
jgi:hypothetical protein